MVRKLTLSISFLCIVVGLCRSQVTDYSKYAEQYGGSDVPDSTSLNYFYLGDIEEQNPYQDSTLNEFEKYAEHRTFDKGSLNLGNLASASYPIIYNSNASIYTDIGFHQYDIYKRNINNFPIYKSNRIFNDLIFSPLNSSQSFFSGAKFFQSFSGDLDLSIDFNRITQEGFYQNQDTKATQLGINFHKVNEAKTHQYFISMTANNFNETHNGGVNVDLYSDVYNTGEVRSQRISVPVNISSTPGETRHQNFSYALDNFYTPDSSKYTFHHQLNIEHGYFRYGDENTTSALDSNVYMSYLTDDRGIRYVNKFWRAINQFDVSFKTKSFNIKVGLNYNLLRFNDANSSESFNDLGVFGQIKFKIKDRIFFDGQAEIGAGENVGNISLFPKIKFKISDKIVLDGFTQIKRYDPSLIQRSAYVSENLVFNNDFNKSNAFVLGGQINMMPLKLKVSLTSGVLTNPVANDNFALPYQLDGSTEYLQLKLRHKLFWKFIGFENDFCYQSFSENIYNLPKIYSIHNLYLQTFLFKRRLDSKIGVLLYNYNYDGTLRFMPVNGQFYPSDEPIQKYYYTELYGIFKVDAFRIFFKMENLTDMILNEPHFNIIDYPQFDATFRMGIRWMLFD